MHGNRYNNNIIFTETVLIKICCLLFVDCSADSEDVKFKTVDLNSSSSWFMSLDDDSDGNILGACLTAECEYILIL